jgi:two-component system nitrate/nitrite response regulator NarL
MHAGTRQVLGVAAPDPKRINPNGDRAKNLLGEERAAHTRHGKHAGAKPRVFVAAENRLVREALSRMLARSGEIEVVGTDVTESFRAEDLIREETDILLLASRGNQIEDLAAIRTVRTAAPSVQILMIGVTGEGAEFLQCVRAGVRGYLPGDASAEDVIDAVRALQADKAVCPGTLCAVLFRYFESEATCLPSASMHQRLGLTRREQQLIPLIAEGLTNKEIANRFYLSEQTVKNHLYRMKHKVGAGDRLGIVQVCRAQGFMP